MSSAQIPRTATPADAVAVSLFGELELQAGQRTLGARDLGGRRPKQVLEILLAARGHLVSHDALAHQLWGDAPPQRVIASLHTFVSVLRRHLARLGECGRALIVTAPEAYRFAHERAVVDLDRFDALTRRAAGAPAEIARPQLRQALALVRGDVLEDEPHADWALSLRRTYRARVLGAQLAAADAALIEGDFEDALRLADRAIELDRFDERAHRAAMLARYALGRQHEALDSHHRLRSLLAEHRGLVPTPASGRLHDAILRHDDLQSLLPARRLTSARRSDADTAPPPADGCRVQLAVADALASGFRLILVETGTHGDAAPVFDRVAGALDGVAIGRATCSRLERELPYVPLAMALRDALGDSLADHADLPALAAILPELGTGEARTALEVLEALAELVRRHAPIVLLIDEIQWADVGTLAALGYLPRRCPSCTGAAVGAVRTHESWPGDPIGHLRPAEVVTM